MIVNQFHQVVLIYQVYNYTKEQHIPMDLIDLDLIMPCTALPHYMAANCIFYSETYMQPSQGYHIQNLEQEKFKNNRPKTFELPMLKCQQICQSN